MSSNTVTSKVKYFFNCGRGRGRRARGREQGGETSGEGDRGSGKWRARARRPPPAGPRAPHVFDDHDQEGQLDAQRLLGVRRACDVGGGHVGARDFEDGGLDVGVCDALDVAVPDCSGAGTGGNGHGYEMRGGNGAAAQRGSREARRRTHTTAERSNQERLTLLVPYC